MAAFDSPHRTCGGGEVTIGGVIVASENENENFCSPPPSLTPYCQTTILSFMRVYRG